MTTAVNNNSLLDYQFLHTQTPGYNETDVDFRLRRLEEECQFFNGLAYEFKGSKIEETHLLRTITRSATQILSGWTWGLVTARPHNVFEYCGIFGYQATDSLTRTLHGAATDETFNERLKVHIFEIASCALELAQVQPSRIPEMSQWLIGCAEGLDAYGESYKIAKDCSLKSIIEKQKNEEPTDHLDPYIDLICVTYQGSELLKRHSQLIYNYKV